MATEIKNVIVAGASGSLGVPLVAELLKAGFTVSALTRSDSKKPAPDGVKVVRSDYTPASLEEAFQGQDAVISAVGFEGIGEQKKLIDAAIVAKVKVFLPSEFGSNTASEAIKNALPFNAGKKDIVDYLKEKQSQISWVACINGPFFDMGLTYGFLGVDLAKKTAVLFDGGETPLTVSTLPQVGRGVAAVLKNLDKTANKYVYFSSTTLTQKDLVAAVEGITGAKLEISHADTKASRVEGFAKLEKHDYSGIVDLLQSVWFEKDSNMGDHRGLLWDQELGLSPEPVEQVVKAVLEKLA